MSNQNTSWIIVGRENGKSQSFRPSDWAYRISEIASSMQDNGIPKYSEYLYPINYRGAKALYVDGKLKLEQVSLFNQVMEFVNLHNLTIVEHEEPIIPFHCILPSQMDHTGSTEVVEKLEAKIG
jgi:hypothetical protein